MSDPYISGFGVEHAETVEKGLFGGAGKYLSRYRYAGQHAKVGRRARAAEHASQGTGHELRMVGTSRRRSYRGRH